MNIWLITEIPGPYRNPHFQELARQFEAQGAHFTVHFMSEEDDIRPDSWFDKTAISYPHFFYPKKTLRIGRRKIYWNRQLVASALKEKPDLIIVGGLWSSLTCFALSLLFPKNHLIGWVELNEMVLGVSNPITNWLRRRLLLKPAALAIPGQSARNYLNTLLGDRKYRELSFVYFPNLIDEELFTTDNASSRSEIIESYRTDGKKIAFWPARLEEEKGILPFLKLLNPDMLHDWRIMLFGEGSLQDTISDYIEQNDLSEVIVLHPYVSPQEVVKIYNSVDLLLLPSLRDPNPLSVIEALRMGLPLFASNAVGNHFEAITERNGWTLHLDQPKGHKIELIQQALATTAEELAIKGVESQRIYEANWGLEKACARTISDAWSVLKIADGTHPTSQRP